MFLAMLWFYIKNSSLVYCETENSEIIQKYNCYIIVLQGGKNNIKHEKTKPQLTLI